MAGKSILKVLFTLTYLSPLGDSVVSAIAFYSVRGSPFYAVKVFRDGAL
jgi:hypothetical protein